MRKFFAEFTGARLCYGEPVRNGEHLVIPVARVRGTAGLGFGGVNGRGGEGGGGGGGSLNAAPAGFIQIGPDGASFQPIPDPETTARALLTGSVAVITTATSLLWLRARGRRSAVGAAPSRRLLRS